MNTNTVLSLPVAADLSAYSNVAVKMTSTGINLAAAGDRIIGTMIRGNDAPQTGQSAVGWPASVFLSGGNGIHFVKLGNNTAVALGDELETWASGRYIKRGGTLAGTAEADDDLITATDHGFVAGQAVVFPSLTGGAGLTAGTTYYVISTGLTANAFSVSATVGGSAVNISTDYSALTVRPSGAGEVAGIAVEAAPANSIGGEIRAILFPTPATRSAVKVLTAATTLTMADSDTTFFLSLAGGFTVTLPTSAGAAGAHYTFIVKTAPTTAYIIASAGGSSGDDIIGYPVASTGGDESANGNTAGDQVNFVASTALPGDMVELWSDGLAWYARATCKATGAITITG